MSETLAERREQMLGLLAEKTLALACAVQQRALEAEGAEEMAQLSQAFVRLSRSVRQSIALHAKLEKDRLSEAPKPKPEQEPQVRAEAPAGPQALAIRRRKAWITRNVERCVWNEYDYEDQTEEFTADSLLEELQERLADLTEDAAAFLDLDPDQLLIQLCQELGLTPPGFHTPAPPAPRANGHDVPAGPDSS